MRETAFPCESMPSTIEANFSPSSFTLPPLITQSPPEYTGSSSDRSTPDTIVNDDTNYTHGPWLLRRTSIHVESTPSHVLDDQSSEQISIVTSRSDEKRAVRNFLAKLSPRQQEESRDDRSSVTESHSTNVFGTTVSIEASQPRKNLTKQREMKGLEEAASVKRWIGNGQPAEAWGKLIKVAERHGRIELPDSNRSRILSYGTLLVTRWSTSAINDLILRSDYSRPC